jgi:ASC-1-like (ASCH) protein
MIKTHECHVSKPYKRLIESCEKDVEGRLRKGVFAVIRSGDRLVVRGDEDDGEPIEATVIAVRQYPSFKRYLEAEGLRRTLPGVETIAEGVKAYRRFYSRAKEVEYGVAAVEIEVLRRKGPQRKRSA